MIIKELMTFLNKELKINEFEDSSINGLQVGKQSQEIEKIAFAVDASLETFQKAKEEGCNLIIVHHGLFWSKNELPTEIMYDRIKFLINNNIALIGIHLPLDAHPKIGNNAQLCKLFNAKIIDKFLVGFKAELNEEKPLIEFIEEINAKLKTKSKVLTNGKENIKTFAVVAGSAASYIHLVEDVDVFITGESRHDNYHFAKEKKLNVIYSGHYATETVGINALKDLIKDKFDILTVFIDIPTSL